MSLAPHVRSSTAKRQVLNIAKGGTTKLTNDRLLYCVWVAVCAVCEVCAVCPCVRAVRAPL